MYIECSLYAIKSKNMLCKLLCLTDKTWLKRSKVLSNVHPYIDTSGKPRLIEAPSIELKKIQRKIKNSLLHCQFPQYVFSGVKNKSYVDNAKIHSGTKYLFKIDITAFFPSTSREKVYKFFIDELKNSPDVAECLTNFCTNDLSSFIRENDCIDNFLKNKKIKHMDHLCTGSSPSPVLSYLVNQAMFDELKNLCNQGNVIMTIYVDDIVFSSCEPICKQFRDRISSIVSKHGYNISKSKVEYYKNNSVKKITGVIIRKDGTIDVPNKLRQKIIHKFNNGKPYEDINKLQGCIIAARQIKKVYPNIFKFVKMENEKAKT
ncbi:MAG: reverse transcriptase family protein [Saccharofermentanales bacterium]